MTTIVIEQPNYIPWIGYFDLIRQSDIWVWYDDVQYTKRDWRNRNCVGRDVREWLTIPVRNKGRFHQLIAEVEIDWSQPWPRTHLGTIRRCYARAPHYGLVAQLLESAFDTASRYLADLTIVLNESICELLRLKPVFARSSAIPRVASDRQDRLIEICRHYDAPVYLSGPAARGYIAPETFEAAGILLRYIEYDYLPYARGPYPFVSHLSILDMLAWLGPCGVSAFLTSNSRSEVN
ncbi:MAG TPA: WbqC family protein [Thermoanaerobaculia bacterium]|nr:WbqC family protein [Thermoanaerobaculia bacterium]